MPKDDNAYPETIIVANFALNDDRDPEASGLFAYRSAAEAVLVAGPEVCCIEVAEYRRVRRVRLTTKLEEA